MRVVTLGGSDGFILSHLNEKMSNTFEINSLSLRDPKWKQFDFNVDCIINLVGKVHDHKGEAIEEDYYYANFQLAKEVFEVFVSSQARLLVHVSSVAVLEEISSNRALTEEDECNPISLYGKSKRAAEQWLLKQELPTGKKLIILRPPMVHGPGDKGNLGLLYKFISKRLPYPLAAFDNQRSFISIGNFCYFIEQIIAHNYKLATSIYHIADDEPMSTSEIINVIKKITGKNTMNFSIPKFLIRGIAKIGDIIPMPLNTKRLKKMTSTLLVSNKLIKSQLGINKLPLTAREGLEKTIRSLK